VPPSPRRPAAFFDLDKTVIAKSSTLAFSRSFYQGGLISRRSVLRSAYAQFVYLVGGADHDQMERMRRYLSRLATGWHVQTVRDIVAETLHVIVDPLVYDEAVSLIEEHHEAGHDVVIVSSSGSEVVSPIGEMLGVEEIIATVMVQDEGRYTGDIDFYAYAENKAVAIRDLAERVGYDLEASYAYSDSITDLPMLEVVGHPFAVNPDKALRRAAAARQWPVLDFTKPVQLRKRVPFESRRGTVAAVALGAAVAAVGAVLLVTRRARRANASSLFPIACQRRRKGAEQLHDLLMAGYPRGDRPIFSGVVGWPVSPGARR
jgi:HAD superfamily hydrolase (TIGR01490 family)